LVDEQHHAAASGSAQRAKRGRIEMRLRLAIVERIAGGAGGGRDGEAIGHDLLDKIVHCHKTVRARYVTDNDGGRARQIGTEEARGEAAKRVGAATGGVADDHGDGLSLEGEGLGDGCETSSCQKTDRKYRVPAEASLSEREPGHRGCTTLCQI